MFMLKCNNHKSKKYILGEGSLMLFFFIELYQENKIFINSMNFFRG